MRDKLFYNRLKIQKQTLKSEIGKPFFCDLLISEKCNSRCKTCYFWKNGIDDELTIDECKNFITALKDCAEMPFEINLGGGEPLLKEGILDLITHCARQGLQPTISTNASLIDREMAKRLSESGLHRLGLSLKSLNEKTHDFLMGVDGSYRRLMDAIEYLRRYWQGKDLNIHTIILEQNLEEIIELVEWVNKDKIFTGISFQALSQPFRTELIDRWYLNSEYGFLWPKDSKKVASVMEALIRYKIAGYRILNPLPQLVIYRRYYQEPDAFARIHKCNFGDYIFNVNALGLVHLCCFMQPVGSIKKNSIKDIWYSERASSTRDAMYSCQKSCNNIVNCYFQEEGDEVQNEVKIILQNLKNDSEERKDKITSSLKQEEEGLLKSCDFILTHYCTLKCKMCYLWNRRKDDNEEEQLGTEEWKRFIDSLMPFSGKEPIRLHFGGGEPFLKEGILELFKYSSQRGFKTITTSNGFLIDEKMAYKIADSGLSHISLSLDSLDEKVHDYIRGINDSHARILNAINYLSRQTNRPTIGINSIISDITLDSIVPLAEWVINDERISGVIFQAVVQPYETPLDDEWYKKEMFKELWPKDIKKVKSVIQQLLELKVQMQKSKDIRGFNGDKISNSVAQLRAFEEYFQEPEALIRKRPCPLDSSSLMVNWVGQVYFCGTLQPIGNVRSLTLEEILMSQMAEERWKEIKSCRRNCNNKVNCFFKEGLIEDGD